MELLKNPLVQALLLIAVGILFHYGRKRFGTIRDGKIVPGTKRSTTMFKLKPIDLNKSQRWLLDTLFPDAPVESMNRYERILLQEVEKQVPTETQKPVPAVSDNRPVADNKAPAIAEPAQATAQAVSELPGSADWNLAAASATHIPFMKDGQREYSVSLLTSQHGVICGASRSGKGNLLQLISLSALSLGPEAVQVWHLDAKQGLDYSYSMNIAHARLYADVRDPDGELLSDDTLENGFHKVIVEMERRNTLMFNRARNIHEYMKKTGERLPIVVVIVDEAAELTSEQQEMLCTIARMGAASGIVLLCSTQYPTADVLPSQVQANALNRIVLQLASSKYTQVALGLAPGERSTYEPSAIKPRGVAIFKSNGGEQVIGRVPEVTDAQREQTLATIIAQWPRSTEPLELLEPVRQTPHDLKLSNQYTRTGTTGSPHQEAVRTGSSLKDVNSRYELVRELVREGKSGNKVHELLGGTRADNLEMVRKARAELQLDKE